MKDFLHELPEQSHHFLLIATPPYIKPESKARHVRSETSASVVTLANSLHVSVVVPVYDGEATIAACIEALLAQTYPRHLTEIIVVDNGSTDGTCAIVQRHPVTLVTESIPTSYAARNRGIAQAVGEVIALTDSDCLPMPDWLTHLVAPLVDPSIGAVLGAIDDAPPQSLVEEFTARVQPFAARTQRALKNLLTANVAIRRTTLTQLGLFDERLPTGADVDLGWRMQQQLQLTIVDAPAAIIMHRHRSTFRGVFAQYRRYGLSEILLTTLYRGGAGTNTPSEQRQRMIRQMRAMATYVASFLFHVVASVTRGIDRRRILWPLFLLTTELGNVVGKIGGLIATHYYRRIPFYERRA
ncbi:MAG TPA: glycosyltransferase [Thermoanaerobaculia bacterium]|jgi:cellulose synthase/poly-beta-1,6-N-acetylglucosamine synthase-like glycosyltransferase|nr:glycosyltransferase [Thermoanaerobaculia bacterium]